jgi:hypothetical protein
MSGGVNSSTVSAAREMMRGWGGEVEVVVVEEENINLPLQKFHQVNTKTAHDVHTTEVKENVATDVVKEVEEVAAAEG